MRRFAILAAIPVAAMLFVGTVAAQEEEVDVPPRVVTPEECQVEPRSAEDLVEVLGLEDAPEEVTPVLSITTVNAPLGEPADPETTLAISETARQLLACIIAGDVPRTAALLTDHGAQRFYGVGPREEDAAETMRNRVAGTPEPRTDPDTYIRLLGITDPTLLPDGRAAAFVIINEPFLDPGGPETLLFVFAQEDGAWLVDDFVDFSIVPVTPPEGTPEATPAAE